MHSVLAKGPNFVYAKDYIVSSYGYDFWNKLIESLPEKSKRVWKGELSLSGEYPFLDFKEMYYTLMHELESIKDFEIAKMYEHIADKSLNYVFKVFISLVTPSFAISNYDKLWAQFFNAGTVETPVAEKGHALVKFSFPEIFLDWVEPACLGFSKKAIELGGGSSLKQTHISTNKVNDELWEVIYELRWLE